MINSEPSSPYTRSAATRRRKTRLKLQDAVTRLLAESPYSDVSVRDIAEAADVSPASVYNIFGTKDELIAAAFEPIAIQLENAARDAIAALEAVEVNPFEVLERLLVEASNAFASSPGLLHVADERGWASSRWSSDTDRSNAAIYYRAPKALADFIQHGQDRGAFFTNFAAAELGWYHMTMLSKTIARNRLQTPEAAAHYVHRFLASNLGHQVSSTES